MTWSIMLTDPVPSLRTSIETARVCLSQRRKEDGYDDTHFSPGRADGLTGLKDWFESPPTVPSGSWRNNCACTTDPLGGEDGPVEGEDEFTDL